MANPTWPASLPVPEASSVSYAPLFDNIIKSPMEVGQKKRRRATWCPDVARFRLVLTQAQYATLDTLFRATLKEVGTFDWNDFRDGSACTYSFQTAPSYSLAAPGANLWYADVELLKQ